MGFGPTTDNNSDRGRGWCRSRSSVRDRSVTVGSTYTSLGFDAITATGRLHFGIGRSSDRSRGSVGGGARLLKLLHGVTGSNLCVTDKSLHFTANCMYK